MKFTSYTADAAAIICNAVAEGCSLPTACEKPGVNVTPPTVYRWLTNQEPNGSDGFKVALDAAKADREKLKDDRADLYVEEALRIADEYEDDYFTDGRGVRRVDTEAIQRSKLRVDTRLKLAAKLAPKRYGDKLNEEKIDTTITVILKTWEAKTECETAKAGDAS